MFKVGDLVKTLINDSDGTYAGFPSGTTGLITEVCSFGERHNPIYSVRFFDNTVAPYYQSDLEVASNV